MSASRPEERVLSHKSRFLAGCCPALCVETEKSGHGCFFTAVEEGTNRRRLHRSGANVRVCMV